MPQISRAAIISLLLLSAITHTSPRSFLPSHKSGGGQETVLIKVVMQEDDFSSLMGMEECGDGDEGCDNRRMVVEAHLDYIYTQHHKP